MAVMTSKQTPKPGDTVVLIEIPPGLLDGLPTEDQEAICDAVGKPIRLNVMQDFIALSAQAES
jgi:hypothetical protein